MKTIDKEVIKELIGDTLLNLLGFENDESLERDAGPFAKLTVNPDKRYYEGYLKGLLTAINCNYKKVKKDVFIVYDNKSNRKIWTFNLKED